MHHRYALAVALAVLTTVAAGSSAFAVNVALVSRAPDRVGRLDAVTVASLNVATTPPVVTTTTSVKPVKPVSRPAPSVTVPLAAMRSAPAKVAPRTRPPASRLLAPVVKPAPAPRKAAAPAKEPETKAPAEKEPPKEPPRESRPGEHDDD